MTSSGRQGDLAARRGLADRQALGEVVQPDADGDQQRELPSRRPGRHATSGARSSATARRRGRARRRGCAATAPVIHRARPGGSVVAAVDPRAPPRSGAPAAGMASGALGEHHGGSLAPPERSTQGQQPDPHRPQQQQRVQVGLAPAQAPVQAGRDGAPGVTRGAACRSASPRATRCPAATEGSTGSYVVRRPSGVHRRSPPAGRRPSRRTARRPSPGGQHRLPGRAGEVDAAVAGPVRRRPAASNGAGHARARRPAAPSRAGAAAAGAARRGRRRGAGARGRGQHRGQGEQAEERADAARAEPRAGDGRGRAARRSVDGRTAGENRWRARRRMLAGAARSGGSTSRVLLPPPRSGAVATSVPAGNRRVSGAAGRQGGAPPGARDNRGARPAAARRSERLHHGSRQHEAAARQRRPLRAPDPSLEPEDEAIHLHRAQRHLHHRPAADARVHRQRLRVRQADRRARRLDPVRRHQASGAGSRRRAGAARGHALRQPALAGRHAHQLPDRATSGCSASRSSRTSSRPARWSACPRRSSWSSPARRPSSSAPSAVSAT